MTFGLRCCQPACRPHPASLPFCVPAVEGLLHASFGFTSRLRLAFRYGCRHRLRLAPFIQRDSAHAGHTGARLSVPRDFSPATAISDARGRPTLERARLYRYSICIKANDGAAKATRHAEDVRHVDMRQNSWCETTP